jgi:hypothetical protein
MGGGVSWDADGAPVAAQSEKHPVRPIIITLTPREIGFYGNDVLNHSSTGDLASGKQR